MKIGLVVPHIFMQDSLLGDVIFSPGTLALDLANEMQGKGHQITLFTPGPITSMANNITADMTLFEKELTFRGDTYLDLLKKHPLTFITLARQVQSELIARAFQMANDNELDVVHIYTNEEDIALPFAQFSTKPVVFTHHDPFNFLVNYRSLFPKYPHLNWLSISHAQRMAMPESTNWIGNIYHGLDPERFQPVYSPGGGYIAYLERVIESKGVHLAIAAIKEHNSKHPDNLLKLKIAGKHYAGKTKNSYWEDVILPSIDGNIIEYIGHIKSDNEKQRFLGNAEALIIPSTFEEPFGMVMIEALACATPVMGLYSGAISEVIKDGITGYVIRKHTHMLDGKEVLDEEKVAQSLSEAMLKTTKLNRGDCRRDFETNFTLKRMAQEHIDAYQSLL